MLSVLVQASLVLVWAYQSEQAEKVGPALAAIALLPAFGPPPLEAVLLYGCVALVLLASNHMLRLGGLCLFVAVGLVTAWIHGQMPSATILGSVFVVLLTGVVPWLPHLSLRVFLHPALVTSLLVAMSLGLIWQGLNSARTYVILRPHAYAELGAWLRANTPAHSMILPVNMNLLSAMSRRPVWVDWKTGAVVMWKPSLYSLWHDRYLAWRDIQTVSQAAQIAAENSIEFVVFQTRDHPVQAGPTWDIVYETHEHWVARITR